MMEINPMEHGFNSITELNDKATELLRSLRSIEKIDVSFFQEKYDILRNFPITKDLIEGLIIDCKKRIES